MHQPHACRIPTATYARFGAEVLLREKAVQHWNFQIIEQERHDSSLASTIEDIYLSIKKAKRAWRRGARVSAEKSRRSPKRGSDVLQVDDIS